MTNAPETRKTHVIRIFGTNQAGDVLQNIWVDIERIDEAKTVYAGDEKTFQGTVKRLKWMDDPNGDDYSPDGNPSRDLVTVKVCSPSQDNLDDPDEWVPVQVIRHLKTRGNVGDVDGQGTQQKFINDELSAARIVEQRRIFHYDTNIDDEVSAATDADSTLKAYVVPGDRYRRDDSSKDEDQYVEHEVIKYLKMRVAGDSRTGSGDDQGKQQKLLNQYLIDQSDPAQLTEVGGQGFNPPYRLDPYQNIVNCRFANSYCGVVFSWYSGTGSVIFLDDSSPFGPNRLGFYKEIAGGTEFSGSFAIADGIPSFPAPSGSSAPTTKQTEAAADFPPSSQGIDGQYLFLFDGNVVTAIDQGGEIVSTTGVSGFYDLVPDNFDPDTTTGAMIQFAVANDTACVAILYVGNCMTVSYPVFNPVSQQYEDTGVGGGEPISAVGYVCVTRDGVSANEIIDGPKEGVLHLTGGTPVGNGQTEFNHELLNESDSPFFTLVKKQKS